MKPKFAAPPLHITLLLNLDTNADSCSLFVPPPRSCRLVLPRDVFCKSFLAARCVYQPQQVLDIYLKLESTICRVNISTWFLPWPWLMQLILASVIGSPSSSSSARHQTGTLSVKRKWKQILNDFVRGVFREKPGSYQTAWRGVRGGAGGNFSISILLHFVSPPFI